MKYPKSLQDLIDSFQKYPGIGPKTAERLAFFTVMKMNAEEVKKFSLSLNEVVEKIKPCKSCGNLTDAEICNICLDETRDNILMVVEGTKELMVLEKTNQYNGKYFVLNGVISPLNGIGPDELDFDKLIKKIDEEKIREIIIATNATVEGEMTALYIKNIVKNKDINIYRIGYGLPAGADIEYADEITLIKALEGKRIM
ncbi:MAG: recombination mediator RecR [Bacilli bacterium]|jgi:recombination protein RecR|nr:recombination mediator RecR [Bacilli bacterium]MDD2682181.1 recombination mediator RecR [Bacilli bacterium]MDD3121739.1 recombination mediator RecR [Bacilli bacterium]MDD4063667.1 recombination mediator RecR [Bacilli bacterium]